MLLRTAITPLATQNITQLIPTRAVELSDVCQTSTVVLSVSSTTITAADGSISTSYSIYPVNKHISQTIEHPKTISLVSIGYASASDQTPYSNAVISNFSSSDSSRSGEQSLPVNAESSSLQTSESVIIAPTLTRSPLSFGISTILPGSSSLDLVIPSTLGPSLIQNGSILASPSSTPITLGLGVAASTTATSSSAAAYTSINPVYTCPRDNDMYYSDTTNRVYQLLCNTDEPDSTITTDFKPRLQSCVDSCGDVNGCIGVSYAGTTGLCSYKSSASNPMGSSTSDSAILADYVCPGADGTRLVDSSGSVYEILCNTFFPTSNNITSSLTTSDLASCSEVCSDTSDCLGFTFQDGFCTLVSDRNSRDGVTRNNVTTAILLSKRIAQVVLSGSGIPYRITSLAGSLPVDISRTPSSTRQILTTSFATAQTSETFSVASRSAILVSNEITPTTTKTTNSVLFSLSGSGLSNSPSSALLSVVSSRYTIATSSSTASTASVLTSSVSTQLTSAVIASSLLTPIISSTSIEFATLPSGTNVSSVVIDPSTLSDIRFTLTSTRNLQTINDRSTETPTILLTSSLTSPLQSSALLVASRSSIYTNTALLSSSVISAINGGMGVVSRTTSAAEQTSTEVVASPSLMDTLSSSSSSIRVGSSSSGIVTASFSGIFTASFSTGVASPSSVSIARSSLSLAVSSAFGIVPSSSSVRIVPSLSTRTIFSSTVSIALSSSVSSVSFSSVMATSSSVLPSSPPQTTYSCPAADGDQIQANTGGLYTIGCDKETTGGGTLVGSSTDFNSCMTYCDQTPGCTAWTYNGNCYLKNGSSASEFSFQPSTRGTVSGIRSVPARPGGIGSISPTVSSALSAPPAPSALSVSSASSASSAPFPDQSMPITSLSDPITTGNPSTYTSSSALVSDSRTAESPSSYTTLASNSIAIDASSGEPLSSTALYQSTSQLMLTSSLSISSIISSQPSSLTSTLSEDILSVIVSTITTAYTAEEPSSYTTSASNTIAIDASSGVPLSSTALHQSASQSTSTSSLMISSVTRPQSSFLISTISEDISSVVVPTIITAQTTEDIVVSLSSMGNPVTLLSSGLNDVSTLISRNTASETGTFTTELGATPKVVVSSVVPTSMEISIDSNLPKTSYITTPVSSTIAPFVSDLPPRPTSPNAGSLSTNTDTLPFSTTIHTTLLSLTESSPTVTNALSLATTVHGISPTVSCSVYDNVLDICLDTAITPSVGAGGDINVGLGSSTINIVGISATLGIAPSIAVSGGVGLSVGTNGVVIGASATVGADLGSSESSRSATTTFMPSVVSLPSGTSSPSVMCSAGGNVLDVCIDAAITPSVGVGGGGNAGVGGIVQSSTITLLDVSASLAVVPSVTAGADVGLSIGSSGIGLSPSASIGVGLSLDASGTITVGPILPTIVASSTSTTNCSAGGNVLNICIEANITPSVAVSAGLDLNLGPSSSAVTLLDVSVSVGIAPSASVGLNLGLSAGSSGIGLALSATVGLDLGLGLGLGAGGSGQSKSSSISSVRSTSSSTTPVSSVGPSRSMFTSPSPSGLATTIAASPRGVLTSVVGGLAGRGVEFKVTP